MDNTDFFDKIIKSMTTVIKKPLILSNIKNASKIMAAVGMFCATNFLFHFVYNFKINKVLESQDNIEKKLEIMNKYKENTYEVLLSLLKLNDNLFSEIRLLSKLVKNINIDIGEINTKIDTLNNLNIITDSVYDNIIECEKETRTRPITIEETLDTVIEELTSPMSSQSYDVYTF
jgi:hypothetical protein